MKTEIPPLDLGDYIKNRNKAKYQAPIPKPKSRERGELGGGKICVRSGK